MTETKLQPVILAGGSGTRLWPISRGDYPKQLLQLTEEHTMLQATALRLAPLQDANNRVDVLAPIIVCGEDLRFLVSGQLNEINRDSPTVILEPEGKNTAPAIAAAAALSATRDPDTTLVIMPADHAIGNPNAFCAAVQRAAQVCRDGEYIATLGVKPTHAETGFGYIRQGQQTETGVFDLAAFVEKPIPEVAEQLFSDGQHYWNAGIFVGRACVLQRAMKVHANAIHTAAEAAVANGEYDGEFFRLDREAFAESPSDSMDYAVMEKLQASSDSTDVASEPLDHAVGAIVVPLDAGWSDVGSWEALLDVLTPDADGNVNQGDVLTIGARNSVHVSTSRLVTSLGVDGLIIVETPDAVLVTPKENSQQVKEIVAELKAAGRPEATSHHKVYRPWGTFESLDRGERYQVKRLTMNPGATLSLQLHYHRSEHWVIVRGTARVTRDDDVFLLSENESVYLPVGTKHRLENPGRIPLEVIEVQSGSYLGEDDIVRFEDVYKHD